MIKVNIHQAKTHLSKYLAKLKKGEVIVICNRNIPIAELRSVIAKPANPRPIGLAKKQFDISADFFKPLPDEFTRYFYSEKKL